MFIKPWLLDKLNSFKHPQPLLTFVSILFDFNNSSDSDVELQHTFNINSDLRQLNSIRRYSFNLTIIGYPALPSITHPSRWVSQWGSHPHYFTFSSFIQNHLSNQCSTSKDLLIDHPNQPFVDSVVHEFSVGFWPFAHTHYSVYPLTVDDSGEPPKSSEQLEFLNKQIQMEVNTDCYSAPFGPDLLPGVINRIVGELSDGQSVEGNSTEG